MRRVAVHQALSELGVDQKLSVVHDLSSGKSTAVRRFRRKSENGGCGRLLILNVSSSSVKNVGRNSRNGLGDYMRKMRLPRVRVRARGPMWAST